MITCINYANKRFEKAQRFNSEMALKYGQASQVVECKPEMIEDGFYLKNKKILDNPKGAGYWLWKPYFFYKYLSNIKSGDYLFYSDSGSHCISSIHHLINAMNQQNQEVMSFELDLKEIAWTKDITFKLMNCDTESYRETNQRLASFLLAKKTEFSLHFFSEYLEYCQNFDAISDDENDTRAPSHTEFISHRHDQSIYSLLCKKYGLIPFRDPSQWGNPRINDFPLSNYPQVIEHTRHRIPKHAKLKYRLKRLAKDLLR